MHLIFVHGVPGVGKRTVCNELATLTGFPFFNAHHIAVALGPVFGFSTAFNRLRDGMYDGVIEAAFAAGHAGLIATCIFEPSVRIPRFKRHADRARTTSGRTLFAGLRCDDDALRARVESPERLAAGKWTDFEALQRMMVSGYFDFPPDLPGDSLVLDTTMLPAAETAARIAERLNVTATSGDER